MHRFELCAGLQGNLRSLYATVSYFNSISVLEYLAASLELSYRVIKQIDSLALESCIWNASEEYMKQRGGHTCSLSSANELRMRCTPLPLVARSTSPSKLQDLESPILAGRNAGNVVSRNSRLAADPHVVYTWTENFGVSASNCEYALCKLQIVEFIEHSLRTGKTDWY